MRPVQAQWGSYAGTPQSRDVTGADEAVALCREIETETGSGRLLVGFTEPNGHYLGIGLGADRSVLVYWDSLDPPYYQTSGDPDADGGLDFSLDGHHTEMAASALIDRAHAFAALAEFMQTGDQPTGVTWVET